MHQVYLGLGSNINAERNIYAGIAALEALFADVTLSSLYRSEAVGFDGAPFLNLVMGIKTDLPLGKLAATLRELEYHYGRRINTPKFTSRNLDIDILTFDDYCGVYGTVTLPRSEVLENVYVLCPFAELAPALILPGQSLTLKELWQRYSNPYQSVEMFGSVNRKHMAFCSRSPAMDSRLCDPPPVSICADRHIAKIDGGIDGEVNATSPLMKLKHAP